MAKRKKNIIKLSGEPDLFDEEKLRGSLQRSGAAGQVIDGIIRRIREEIYEGMPSREIFNLAFSMLRRNSRPAASRYKLKRALMELGPTGFPFEIYIGELFKFKKFETKVGSVMKGHCVSHEVDILAKKDNLLYMVECKFHNDLGSMSNVKVPMYVHSRFKDLETVWRREKAHGHRQYHCGVATNTRFTSDALQYGTCMGIYMLSWNHPVNDSLKLQIDRSGLYPVTSLLSLTAYEKRKLLDKGIVLCKSLAANRAALLEINVTTARIENILKEADSVCEGEEFIFK
jgi:hypothetical protein